MDQVRHGGGTAAGRIIPGIVRAILCEAPPLSALPALRFLFWPRGQPLGESSDRLLGDVGLTRADVASPAERTPSAELEMQRLLHGRGWR